MKNYFYCESCNELIHKDNTSDLDGNDVCPYCRGDLEHSEDLSEDYEFYEAMKQCERDEIERNKMKDENQ